MPDHGFQWLFDAALQIGIYAVMAGVVVFVVLRWFLPGYLSEKGKYLATREDFKALLEQLKKTTEATESIKIELSSRHWLNQQRWNIREKCYRNLLLSLTRLRMSLQDRSEYYFEPGSEHDKQSEHEKELSRVGGESLHCVREQIGPASIFLSDKAISSLEELIHEHWYPANNSCCNAEYVTSALKLVDAAYSAVLAEGRIELAVHSTDDLTTRKDVG